MPETAFARVRPAAPPDLAGVLAMLDRAGLPTAGVPPSLTGFLVAESGTRLVGVIGLEAYGPVALLRSAVVAADARGAGVGASLVTRLLARAGSQGIHDVYLLTTTAEAWFPRFGFVGVTRDAVPEALHASEEFKGACPDSAVVMHAALT
jgi:amino-acid N-acetyltransferase